MKKKILTICMLFLFLAVSFMVFFFFSSFRVDSIQYEIHEKKIYAILKFKGNMKDGTCQIQNQVYPIIDYTCQIPVLNESVDVVVSTHFQKKRISIDPDQNKVLDFTLSSEKIYLLQEEQESITLAFDVIGYPDISYTFKSEDESVAKTIENSIIGVGPGRTKVKVIVGELSKEIEVVVTDLLTKPILNKNKKILPCGVYSEEQNRLLDEFLEYRVNQAGFKTRGAVVAVARFLTLEFPYKVAYFFENGRLHNNTGGPAADGEGRFYHRGLYLHNYKFQELDRSKVRWGPVTWGCPLLNWEDDGKYKYGERYPNGLDCSGLVTWILLNAGFDPKDVGAGDTAYVDDDLGDFGPHHPITREFLESNQIKVGDIIGSNGHSAIVGGVLPGRIFVVESTTYFDGVVMHEYTYDELMQMPFLTYVISMDTYYQEEGIYTDYWE